MPDTHEKHPQRGVLVQQKNRAKSGRNGKQTQQCGNGELKIVAVACPAKDAGDVVMDESMKWPL
jgi:hypothetical protein